MDIEFANSVIDNASLFFNGLLFCLYRHYKTSKDYWVDSWHEERQVVKELEEKLAKFDHVGGE